MKQSQPKDLSAACPTPVCKLRPMRRQRQLQFCILSFFCDWLICVNDSRNKAFRMICFATIDLGGVQVSHDRIADTLGSNHGNYKKTIFKRYGSVNCRSVSTPGACMPWDLDVDPLLYQEDKQLHEEIVGSLNYLSNRTHWDVACTVMQRTRPMSNPRVYHKPCGGKEGTSSPAGST